MVRDGMMPTSADMIREELRGVFPAIRPCPFGSLARSEAAEALSLTEEFKDREDWTELKGDFLDRVPRGLGSALFFFADQAICFYIPAYLTADILGQLNRPDPAFALTLGFDDLSRERRVGPHSEETWNDHSRRRWARLTKPQVGATVHYLEWKIDQGGVYMEHAIAEALKSYWYESAGT